tara:strand:- start:70886 stop:71608 length:723 start_codon:yes stop_codon:yes gene_type:complete
MDLTILFEGALAQLWYFLPFFIFVMVIKSAWFKGIMGEFLVNLLLKHFLSKKVYTLIKNVTLPTEDGTTQIDHIVVSPFGVFVIETKNMKGWIFGNAKQKQWTQKIFKYTGKFQNPLHQNYKHTQTLASCLNIPSEQIYSVVVFVGDSTFKTEMPPNVTFARGCITYIKSQKSLLISSEKVNEIIKTIEVGKLRRGLKTNSQHNRHVKGIVKHKIETETANNQVTEQDNAPSGTSESNAI